jgi:hypothetical protein
MRGFVICTHPQITLCISNQGKSGRLGMWHAWERRRNCTRFSLERPKEGDHLENQGVDGIRMALTEISCGCRVDPIGSGYGPVTCSCEYGDEPSCSSRTDLVIFGESTNYGNSPSGFLRQLFLLLLRGRCCPEWSSRTHSWFFSYHKTPAPSNTVVKMRGCPQYVFLLSCLEWRPIILNEQSQRH